MATAKTSNKAKTTAADGLQAIAIPLTEIDADFTWNSRSGTLSQDSQDEERSDFSALVSSIRINGQDEPVDVRPKKSGKGYLLTTGFRRFSAISKIAKDDGREKTATILAFVRNDNDEQARARNLRENSARDNLKGSDLAFGVWDLFQRQSKAGKNPSSVGIASDLGKNQAYIARLIRIMSKGDEKVVKTWREAPFNISIADMLKVVEFDKDRQEAALKELLDAKAGKSESGEKGPNRWVETAIASAEKVGELLGRLEKHGLVNTDGLDFELPEHLEYCLKSINPKATPAQKHKIGKAAQKAYEAALNASDEPEETRESGKAKRNGAQANA